MRDCSYFIILDNLDPFDANWSNDSNLLIH